MHRCILSPQPLQPRSAVPCAKPYPTTTRRVLRASSGLLDKGDRVRHSPAEWQVTDTRLYLGFLGSSQPDSRLYILESVMTIYSSTCAWRLSRCIARQDTKPYHTSGALRRRHSPSTLGTKRGPRCKSRETSERPCSTSALPSRNASCGSMLCASISQTILRRASRWL